MNRYEAKKRGARLLFQSSLASVAGEAARVVGVAQRRDHPPLHVVPTRPTLGAKLDVVVLAAEVLVMLHEVAARCQLLATRCTDDRERER